MARSDYDAILDECLERLARGESVAACLAHYPKLATQLEPPLKMSLERALEYIGSDEYVEATPKNLRLRKKELDETKRKRAAQKGGVRLMADAE